jgi:CheY-like chemotaxis protein
MTSSVRKTILITDVDRAGREALREVFEPAGFRTLLANSGEEALSLSNEYEIHVAFFDMYLPRLNGLETVEMARKIRGLWIPTILIASEQNDRLLSRALKARVHCVLNKPVDKPLAIRAVNRILEKFY